MLPSQIASLRTLEAISDDDRALDKTPLRALSSANSRMRRVREFVKRTAPRSFAQTRSHLAGKHIRSPWMGTSIGAHYVVSRRRTLSARQMVSLDLQTDCGISEQHVRARVISLDPIPNELLVCDAGSTWTKEVRKARRKSRRP